MLGSVQQPQYDSQQDQRNEAQSVIEVSQAEQCADHEGWPQRWFRVTNLTINGNIDAGRQAIAARLIGANRFTGGSRQIWIGYDRRLGRAGWDRQRLKSG